MAEPNITEEVHFEMLEKKADGSFKAKYPKVKSKSGVTFDEHLAEKATQTTLGHIKLSDIPNTVIVTGSKVITETDNFINLGFRPRYVKMNAMIEGSVTAYMVEVFSTTPKGNAYIHQAESQTPHTYMGVDLVTIENYGFSVAKNVGKIEYLAIR